MNFPTHCHRCGVPLMGGATRHLKTCPLYPISVVGIQESGWPESFKLLLNAPKTNLESPIRDEK
jgi:hypothetical protein